MLGQLIGWLVWTVFWEGVLGFLWKGMRELGKEGVEVVAGPFGFAWSVWSRLSVLSWWLVVILSWVEMLSLWIRDPGEEGSSVLLVLIGVCLVLGNVLPVVAAVLSGAMRKQLLVVPEAAALMVLVGPWVVAMGVALVLEDPSSVVAGLFIAVMGFAVSLGLLFPVGIPLLMSLWVRRRLARGCGLSLSGWAVAIGVSGIGWLVAVYAGMMLGYA